MLSKLVLEPATAEERSCDNPRVGIGGGVRASPDPEVVADKDELDDEWFIG